MREVIDTVPYGKWGQVVKVNQVLPPEVYETFQNYFGSSRLGTATRACTLPAARSAYIWKLKDLGWTGSAIADAMNVTRERVRQLSQFKPEDHWLDYVLAQCPLPLPPVYAEYRKHVRVTPQPSDRTRARLLELRPIAESIRGNSPRHRAEADEYVRLLDYAVRVENVQIATLARLLGVTNAAVSNRMIRYGLKKTTGKSKAVKRIKKSNQVNWRQK
jgi:plasmid maintenance system antidote protein VapI